MPDAPIGGRIIGYVADQAGGDDTYAFHEVTISAGLAFLATIGNYSFSRMREQVA